MKITKKIALCIVPLLLCACTVGSEYDKQYDEEKSKELPIFLSSDLDNKMQSLDKFEINLIKGYKTKKIKIDEVGKINGILCRKDDILISDEKNDRLVKINYQGDFIDEIGRKGDGELEFTRPSKIKEYNNKVYVLDAGNYRVKVLDENLKYIDDIKVDIGNNLKKDNEYLLTYMDVNKQGIYLNGLSYNENDRVIYYDFDTNQISNLGDNFFGPIISYEDKIYAINKFVKSYKKDDDIIEYRTGTNSLFFIDGDDLTFRNECELPIGMCISDFIFFDDKIIAISESFCSVNIFSKNGKYIGTIDTDIKLQNIIDESRCIDHNNSRIYISSFIPNEIYIFEKVE